MGDVIIDGLTGANRLVVLDANGKIPAVDGSAVTNVAGANFSTGTIPVARLDTGTTAGKVDKLDGNAKLPAVSGAALTGIVAATQSASDPTISTNPSGGVGTEWQNTTSGEVYICTDATAGANVWSNVGEHSGDIQLEWGGSSYGYTKGSSGNTNVIDRYSYTSDGNAADVGDLAQGRAASNCTQNETVSYIAGGSTSSGGTPANLSSIEKFTYASGGNAVAQTATLLGNRGFGSTSCTRTYGYWAGYDNVTQDNVIQKWSMTSDSDATDIGNLTINKGRNAGQTDLSGGYGYSSGSHPGGSNVIDRYSHSSDGNATDVGDLTEGRGASGNSSTTHGYTATGFNGSAATDRIDKFAWGSSVTSTDVGNVVTARYWGDGTSSTTYGYTCGGDGANDMIDKFSFSTDGNATDVGNSTRAYTNVGSQGFHF